MDIITLMTSVEPSRSGVFTATVIIAGLGIVLATLAILIVVFYAFGSLVSKTEAKAAKKKAEKAEKLAAAKASFAETNAPMPKKTETVAAPVAENGISGEVVAAISAAVYSIEGAGAQIKSIAPVRNTKSNPITSRNPWAQSAVIENTKPF